MITVNLFQPEIFSKADSERTRCEYYMWQLYFVLITVKLFQREVFSRTDPKLFDNTHALRILHVVTILPSYRFSRDYTTVAII